MSDPYLILGVPADADDAAVESAYLAGIKQCPPERDAERFKALRMAYEALRTHRDRLAVELFDTSRPDTRDLLDQAAPIGTPRRPEPALIQALLQRAD